MSCKPIKKPARRVCIGDMRDAISLMVRAIQPPSGSVDFGEAFTLLNAEQEYIAAMIQTVNGVTYFDGVNPEAKITHYFFVPYDAAITSQAWVYFESRRFKIYNVEDLDEKHEVMRLVCEDKGLIAKPGSAA